jgi:glycosyltransferase involved in cell wall biosynthesis
MISVIIPVANEQATIAPLCQALEQALPAPYEIVFVDDGSTDGTWEQISRLHRQGRVRALRFRRNFGKTAALQAGFAAARGDVVFTIDGDLQDDPAEIPRFLAMLEEGYDLVSGWKKYRQDPFGKIVASRLFNFVVCRISGIRLHDINCGFKAYRGELARSLKLQGEMHRFTPVLAQAMGYRVGELVVKHHTRLHGKSHYGFSRMFKGLLDLITVMLVTRYAHRPAHAFGLAALAAFLVGMALVFLPWWQALFAGVAALVSAVVLLSAGFLAELLAYRATFDIPAYNIREQLD